MERIWLFVIQVLAYAVFGFGALLVGLTFVPLVSLAPVSKEKKIDLIQWLIHFSFRWFVGFILTLKGMEVTIDNRERLRATGPSVVVANHPTLLDVVLLVSYLPQADCIIKSDLLKNPFLRRVVTLAGYIPNDGGISVVTEAIERIRRGRKVVIFPEGTRSGPQGLRPFNKGFSHIAVRSSCPVTPVFLKCVPGMLAKESPVWAVPPRRPRFHAHVGVSIAPPDYRRGNDTVAVAVRKFSSAVHRQFQENQNVIRPRVGV